MALKIIIDPKDNAQPNSKVQSIHYDYIIAFGVKSLHLYSTAIESDIYIVVGIHLDVFPIWSEKQIKNMITIEPIYKAP